MIDRVSFSHTAHTVYHLPLHFLPGMSIKKEKKKTELFDVEIEVMEGMFLVATQHVRTWDTPSTFYSPNKA